VYNYLLFNKITEDLQEEYKEIKHDFEDLCLQPFIEIG